MAVHGAQGEELKTLQISRGFSFAQFRLWLRRGHSRRPASLIRQSITARRRRRSTFPMWDRLRSGLCRIKQDIRHDRGCLGSWDCPVHGRYAEAPVTLSSQSLRTWNGRKGPARGMKVWGRNGNSLRFLVRQMPSRCWRRRQIDGPAGVLAFEPVGSR